MYSRVPIDLSSGQRSDLSTLPTAQAVVASSTNTDLSVAGEVQARYAEEVITGSITALEDGETLVASGETLADDFDVVGAASHRGDLLWYTPGRLFAKRGSSLQEVGPHWSVTAEDISVAPPVPVRLASVCVGSNILGYATEKPDSYYTSFDGVRPLDTGPVSLLEESCCAGPVLFAATSGTLRMRSGFPATTTVAIAADYNGSGIDAVELSPGLYAVAYPRVADVRIILVDSAGSITAATTVTTAPLDVASGTKFARLGYNQVTDRLTLVAGSATVSAVLVIARFVGTTLVSTVSDTVVLPGSPRDAAVGCQPGMGADAWRVLVTASLGILSLYSFPEGTSGSVVLKETLSEMDMGSGSPGGRTVGWSILFPPTQFRDRLVFGALSFLNDSASSTFNPLHSATWLVFDAHSLAVVASGDEGTTAFTPQGSARGGDDLTFGYFTGTSYTDGVITHGRPVATTLRCAPAAAVDVAGGTLLSGQTAYFYDGTRSFAEGFHLRPTLYATPAALGTLPAGSYSFQTTWRYTDSLGNVHRSAPSDKVTVTVGAAGSVNLSTTIPHWLDRSLGQDEVETELWMTTTNPGQNAGLYLHSRQKAPGTYAAFGVSGFTTTPITAAEPLYTNGGIMENNRPVANAGLAAAGSRVWSSDGYRLLGSKLVQPGSAAAWSYLADDSLTIQVPASGGLVTALCGIDDLLVVLCQHAVYVLGGNGPSDAGGPSDFQTPREVYRVAGPILPSGVCRTPQGVAWVSSTGGVHLLNAGGQGAEIGVPLGPGVQATRVLCDHSSPARLYLANTGDSGVRVCVIPLAAWSTYDLEAPVTDIALSRQGSFNLTGLTTVRPTNTVSILTWLNPQTRHTSFQVVTSYQSLGNTGRVKSVAPQGRLLSGTGSMTIGILADRGSAYQSKTFPLTLVGRGDHPRSEMPLWTIPRPSMASFSLSFEVTGLVALSHAVVELQSQLQEVRSNR